MARRGEPFAVHTELTPAPWNADRLLLRVGVRAMDAVRSELPPANLVFLVDVSGSMTAANKLPLLKNALRLLTDTLRPQDRVSLVTYASGTRVVLPPTPGSERGKIDRGRGTGHRRVSGQGGAEPSRPVGHSLR